MLTKADFQQAIKDSIAAYPAVAPLYQAGDPRITQNLDAMATMLAMFSAQLEVAMAEPFEKTRDATVMADASMRGIVRKSTPLRVVIQAKNTGTSSFLLDSGRRVMDSAGLFYRLETSALIDPGTTSTVEASQITTTTVTHTVAGSEPFYAIAIPASEDGSTLCGVAVSDGDGDYVYSQRYVNIAAGERVFHIEADDRQQAYVRFGFDGVVGTQPLDGRVVTLKVSYSMGDVTVDYASPFSLEYLLTPAESLVELSMAAVAIPGKNPISMSVLRDLARYPSVYDHNAVFLGEFDFLVRRNFPTLQFLSVWNESAEEQARGPSVDNINTLFVACLSADGLESVLTQSDPVAAVNPVLISTLTGTQTEIRGTILAADDSYRVKFMTPVRAKIPMTVTALVGTSYVASDIRQKIIEAILAEFGEAAPASRRGRNHPLYQRVYALLKEKIAALSSGNSDLTVNITDSALLGVRPEMWRYVALDSLTVTVNTANVLTPSWGG